LKTGVFEEGAALRTVEPLVWLTDVLEQLLPWVWRAERLEAAVRGNA
jgi:hypothetical protein